MLFKGDKYVNAAARLLGSGPAEAGGLSASSLPGSADRQARMLDSLLKSLCAKQRPIAFPRREEVSNMGGHPKPNPFYTYKRIIK